jgi:hypothetical protein
VGGPRSNTARRPALCKCRDRCSWTPRDHVRPLIAIGRFSADHQVRSNIGIAAKV